MPTKIPTKAELQKGYRQLENFVLDNKVQTVLQQAAKSQDTVKKLKADPVKYFSDRRLKVPENARINISISRLRICFWICRNYGRYVICVRHCIPIIIIVV